MNVYFLELFIHAVDEVQSNIGVKHSMMQGIQMTNRLLLMFLENSRQIKEINSLGKDRNETKSLNLKIDELLKYKIHVHFIVYINTKPQIM